MENERLEHIRKNTNKENLKNLLAAISDETDTREGPQYTEDFKKGIYYTVNMIRNFFKL